MARLSKMDEVGKIVTMLKTFSYTVDGDGYKIPVTVIAKDEHQANDLIAKEYPDGKPTLVFRGLRCIIAGIDKK